MGWETKFYINGPGHMTKMAAMPIYGKNLYKSSPPEPRGRTDAVLSASDFGPRGPWFEPRQRAVRCGLEQVTFTPCSVLVKPRKRWTDDRHGQTVTRLETSLCLMC